MERYTIYWESKMSGQKGNGTATFTLQEAEDIVKDMNEKYPDIIHWAQIVNN